MTYRLLAIDVDGTLQNSDHQVSDRNAEALQRAVAAGWHVVLTTGKQYSTILHHIERMKLTSPQITAGGAIITTPQDGLEIYRRDIPPDIARQILVRADELGITAIAFRDGKTFTRKLNRDIEYMLTYGDPYPTFMDDVSQSFDLPPVQMMCIAYQNDVLYEQAYQAFLATFGVLVEVRKSSPYYIEFTALNVSKGTALRWLTQHLGIALEEVVAIGDSYNDLSMFEVAGLAVAVENAPETVRLAAHQITASNNHDGVAQIVQQLLESLDT